MLEVGASICCCLGLCFFFLFLLWSRVLRAGRSFRFLTWTMLLGNRVQANCHIMACGNPLLACLQPSFSFSCEMHTGGSSTCVLFPPLAKADGIVWLCIPFSFFLVLLRVAMNRNVRRSRFQVSSLEEGEPRPAYRCQVW